jgi:hypothetical protein
MDIRQFDDDLQATISKISLQIDFFTWEWKIG